MLEQLLQVDSPMYLNPKAKEMLAQAKATAKSLSLDKTCFVEVGKDTVLFTWTGTRINRTLLLIGLSTGRKVTDIGIGLLFGDTSEADLQKALKEISGQEIDGARLAEGASNKEIEKYDSFLPEELLNRAYFQNCLDIEGAKAWLNATFLNA